MKYKLWITCVIAMPVIMWIMYLFLLTHFDFDANEVLYQLGLAVASSLAALWLLRGEIK
jgi:membrane protease YdiL (CAAX protease family)